MIRWIAFDAVGTLIEPHPSVAVAYHAIGERYGSRLGVEDVRRRFRAAFSRSEDEDAVAMNGETLAYATSEVRERRRWERIVAEVLDDCAELEPCFRELWNHFADPASWRCFEDVAPSLARLATEGVRFAIASNFDSRLHAVCDGLPELAGIRTRVVSSEVGHRKPGAGFFKALQVRLGCAAEELLVVGDDWKNDVCGALEIGMQAVFLERGRDASVRESSLRPGVMTVRTLADLRLT
ncbi:MAG: HAD-IA family hydrolase [Planctomycetaceae bacterium]|nr:HAD-IA family hydrolase [Planctomycetaceae bacterium]